MTSISELPYETPEEKDAFDFIESRQGDSVPETKEEKFLRLFKQDYLAKDGTVDVYAIAKKAEHLNQQREQK